MISPEPTVSSRVTLSTYSSLSFDFQATISSHIKERKREKKTREKVQFLCSSLNSYTVIAVRISLMADIKISWRAFTQHSPRFWDWFTSINQLEPTSFSPSCEPTFLVPNQFYYFGLNTLANSRLGWWIGTRTEP